MRIPKWGLLFNSFLRLLSQEVAQPRAKRRFAVALGTACGQVPTELKVRINGHLTIEYHHLSSALVWSVP